MAHVGFTRIRAGQDLLSMVPCLAIVHDVRALVAGFS